MSDEQATAPADAVPAAEPMSKDDMLAFLEGELSKEAHKVAVDLIDDIPAFLAHLELHLPAWTFGIVQKWSGVEL